MKLTTVLCACLAVCLLTPFLVHAQSTKDQVKAAQNAIEADKKRVVTENMEFTEAEAKAFWPLYEKYQDDQKKIGKRMTELIENYGKVHKVMNDDAAEKLLNKQFAIQMDRVKLMQEYLPKFKEILPMTKVARYYQIENKYRAALDYEISKGIPLVEQ